MPESQIPELYCVSRQFVVSSFHAHNVVLQVCLIAHLSCQNGEVDIGIKCASLAYRVPYWLVSLILDLFIRLIKSDDGPVLYNSKLVSHK